jgi:hypothetical protein
LVPSSQCFVLSPPFLAYSPRTNPLHKTISPTGSLHQLPNPLFPYTIQPFLAWTLFFLTTLNMLAASCSKMLAFNSQLSRRHIPHNINLRQQCCKTSTHSFSYLLSVQRKQLAAVAVILIFGMWNTQYV